MLKSHTFVLQMSVLGSARSKVLVDFRQLLDIRWGLNTPLLTPVQKLSRTPGIRVKIKLKAMIVFILKQPSSTKQQTFQEIGFI